MLPIVLPLLLFLTGVGNPSRDSEFPKEILSPEATVGVKVRQSVCFAPCQVEAIVTVVAPLGTNVCFAVNSMDYGRSSCWLHEGYTKTSITFKNVPTGYYQAIAAIEVSGKTKRVSTEIMVISLGD